MKKGILFTVLIASILFLGQAAKAQDYRIAAGLKFSYEFGPTGKYFINETDALEAQLGLRAHGAVVTALWERHFKPFDVPGLKLYYGFGAHLGGTGESSNPRFNKTILLGADGIVGGEYLIPESPIAISVDLNPRLELGHGPYFDLSPGIGLKYFFK